MEVVVGGRGVCGGLWVLVVLGCQAQVTQVGPTITLDVGERFREVEARLATQKDQGDAGRANYAVLQALCLAGGERDCTTAHFPARIPHHLWPWGCKVRTGDGTVTWLPPERCTQDLPCEPTPLHEMAGGVDASALPPGNGCLEVAAWWEGSAEVSSLLARAVPLDLRGDALLREVGTTSELTVEGVEVHFLENTVGQPLPATACYVGARSNPEERDDVAAMIRDGALQFFGDVGEVAAGFVGVQEVGMDPGGADLLARRLRRLDVTLGAVAQVRVPPPEPGRAANCRAPGHAPSNLDGSCAWFARPGGTVTIKVVATLSASPPLDAPGGESSRHRPASAPPADR
jgi:hypothetical protein